MLAQCLLIVSPLSAQCYLNERSMLGELSELSVVLMKESSVQSQPLNPNQLIPLRSLTSDIKAFVSPLPMRETLCKMRRRMEYIEIMYVMYVAYWRQGHTGNRSALKGGQLVT